MVMGGLIMEGCKKPLVYSILSLSFGIVSWFIFGFISIAGLILGIMSLVDLHKNSDLYVSEEGTKTASLVVGILGVVISGFAVLSWFIGILAVLAMLG